MRKSDFSPLFEPTLPFTTDETLSSIDAALSESIASDISPCFQSFRRSATVPLRPLVGFRPSLKIARFSHSVSHSFSFILSFCLTMSTISHSAAVQNTIPEGVLSSCGCHERSDHSRSSQEYMTWCGCHEILVQRSFNLLFFAHLC